MAIAEVRKVQVLAHGSKKGEVLSSIQEQGIIHLERVDSENKELRSSSADFSQTEEKLQRVSHVLDYLSFWEEKGMVQKLFTPKPQLSKKKREKVLEFDYLPVVEQVEELERTKNKRVSEIRFLQREMAFLSPYKDLNLPVHSIKPTSTVEIQVGPIPISRWEDLKEKAEKEPFWYRVLDQDEKQVYLVLMYPREEGALESLSRDLNFTPVSFSASVLEKAGPEDRIRDVIETEKREIQEKERELRRLDQKAQESAVHRERLMLVHDVLLSETQRLQSSSLLGETEQVCYLEGWIRSSDIKKIKSKLKPFSDYTEMYFRPPLPEEDPPVVLENPRWGKPFEMVTRLYGLPQHKTMDPTLPLAPFFFIFVGLCVSEAGYGILAALLSVFYIRSVKPKGSSLRFFKLLFMLGVSTIIMGALIGGWFGFPIPSLMIFDPVEDPLTFLVLSLALGFVQVWFGTLLQMIEWLKDRQYLRAIFSQGGWLILLPAGVLYFLTSQPLWGYLSLGGMGGILFFSSPSKNPVSRFFGGLYSLYDISRYLADVLSYSRLLALGLATTVIATVVNTLAQNVLGTPVLGWIFAALIFVVGHLFNFGISYLGGFVHSMRLQFVEFFSKFFVSGGRTFKPLELESKFVDFVE